MPTLPQETVEGIIDHLYDDVESLSACSQVARAWLPRSRYNLFDALYLDVDERNIEDFVQVVATTPTISTSIHELDLSGTTRAAMPGGMLDLLMGGFGDDLGMGMRFGRRGRRGKKRVEGGIRAPTLDRLLSSLPVLKDFSLSCAQVQPLLFRERQKYFTIPRGALNNLSISYDRLPLEDFVRTLAAFSRVRVREFLLVQWSPPPLVEDIIVSGLVASAVTSPWKVHGLLAPMRASDALYLVLSKVLDFGVLQHLNLGHDAALRMKPATSRGGLYTFMQHAGPNLHIIDLNASLWFSEPSGGESSTLRNTEECAH